MTIRLLTYSLLIILVSCGNVFRPYPTYTSEKILQTIENPYFTDKEEFLYRASITVYGHSFNGIFVTKRINENEQRIALTTDFGNTLFDFSFIDNKLKINYIQEDLNRKIIIKTLSDDFQKLLKKQFVCNEKIKIPNTTIWKCKDEKEFIYLFENEKQVIFQQINTKKSKKYTTFAFIIDENKNAKNIDIQHYTINIRIILNQM
ncbi:MAG: hypothetical protein Q4C98_00220 [Capnocytophaga sp.]|nr:hypothetical protein [Capnocytophaga sp.]